MLRLLNSGYRDFSVSPVPVVARLNWEIYVVTDGELAPTFDDRREIPLTKKFVWVMPAGLRFGWRSGDAPVMRYAFHFTNLPSMLRNAVDKRGYFARSISDKEVGQIKEIFHRLETHFHKFEPLSALQIERGMIDLSLLILDGVPVISDIPLDHVNEQRVESAISWYLDNMANCPTIEAVASVIHISVGHFRRIFKKVKGLSPYDFFAEMRMAQAKELLSYTSQTLTEVGKHCGFSSSDFCRAFAKHTGVSPNRWRNHVTVQEANNRQ